MLSTLLNASLFMFMMGLGVLLSKKDFARVFSHPKASILGLSLQIFLLPCVAILVCKFILKIDNEWALGFFLLALCPGGPSSNFFTHLAKGDVALSVTLTAVNSIIALVSLPLILPLGFEIYEYGTNNITLATGKIVINLVCLILLPMILGMVFKKLQPIKSQAWGSVLRKTALTILVLCIGWIFWERSTSLVDLSAELVAPTLAILVTAMLLSHAISKKLTSALESKAITIEVTMQNGAQAMALAAGPLSNPSLALPAVFYSLAMYGFVAVYIAAEKLLRKS